jgi:hypothetical protein
MGASTHAQWYGEMKEGRGDAQGGARVQKDLDIPEALASVAGAAAAVCCWGVFCLLGLFSS